MPEEHKATSLYRATVGREVFDMPLEWRVENGDGLCLCVVYDGVTAARIAAALSLAEIAMVGADDATLASAIERFKQASQPQTLI
jgi:hypothetical protein